MGLTELKHIDKLSALRNPEQKDMLSDKTAYRSLKRLPRPKADSRPYPELTFIALLNERTVRVKNYL